MAWQALEDIASAHKLPHPWNRQHERSPQELQRSRRPGAPRGTLPPSRRGRARAWMGVNASEDDRPLTAPPAPPGARLANFLAALADSFWRCACACMRSRPEPSLPSTPSPITSSPSMNSSSGWLKLTRLAACACGVGLG